ncbi:spidroin-2-like [Diprion similis]|uniref:spidroin-2-like n=1 Tax=Diprion similis TaxID=362088 RepID=UPI001EF7A2BA|nr:spidroin-2-like [Diprion similis]
MKIIFALAIFIVSARSDSGFYFPDQLSSHAASHSEASFDGHGNAWADSQSNAGVQNHRSDGPDRPGGPGQFRPGNPPPPFAGPSQVGFYPVNNPPPSFGPGRDQSGSVSANSQASAQGFGENYQQAGPGFAQQGLNPNGLFNSNAQSQASAQSSGNGGFANSQSNSQAQGGLAQSQSNAQSQSSGFDGKGYPYNSVAGATSGSQSNGAGGSSAASAASAASTSFIEGIPVASASAAAAAASAGIGGSGGSSSSANSVATSSGFNQGFQRLPVQPWFTRTRIGEDASSSSSDSLSFSSDEE